MDNQWELLRHNIIMVWRSMAENGKKPTHGAEAETGVPENPLVLTGDQKTNPTREPSTRAQS